MKNLNRYTDVFNYTIIIFMLFVFSMLSCKKLVDIKAPSTRISSDNVYSSDITAIAVLTGIYSKMSNGALDDPPGSIPSLSFWGGLSSDELTLRSGASAKLNAFYKNNLSVTAGGFEFWGNAYSFIYATNAAIEGLDKSVTINPRVKQQLLGEAKFVRALFYFYLTNLYGDAAIVTTTDYTVNSILARAPQSEVYQQIISDLKDAQQLLVDGYVQSDGKTIYPLSSVERVRPCQSAATALLARVYLYTKNNANAEAEATKVINNTVYYSLLPLNEVFLKNSKESIWQLQPVDPFTVNTRDAYKFVLTYSPAGVNATHPVYLSSSLLNSFESGDQRKVNGKWINVYTNSTGSFYYPFKYKDIATGTGVNPSEYSTLLRLGEQYLIRAEARAKQNNLSGAIADIDMIRQRAGLPLIANTNPGISQSALLTTILHERRVELFSELGHRWIDLKRTGNIDGVMAIQSPLKGGTWTSFKQLYPIPIQDIQRNPNLTQNAGY